MTPGDPPAFGLPAPDVPPSGEVPLLRGLTELISGTTDTGGLVGLQLLVELAAAATGSIGASFVEYGPDDGRVVAACGSAQFMLGRPIDPQSPEIAEAVANSAPGQVTLVRLTPVLRMLRTSAVVGDVVVGSIQIYLPGGAGGVPSAAEAWLRLFGTCAAQLYVSENGLPAGESGDPSLDPVSLPIVVVTPEGTVRAWNGHAERLTAVAAVEAVGRTFPFPLPRSGQSTVHRLANGTRVRIRATRLAGTRSRVLYLRPEPETDPRDRSRDESRDLFLAVASHELRTPVTVIRGYADTLVEHWDALKEADRREAVTVLGQRARELARLVDRLLSAASDAAGVGDGATPVPFDVIDALREVERDLAPEIRAAVDLDLPGALPKATGDRAGILTVVTELVTNACKYSPARVKVDVTAGADTQTVWFRVSDRGVGIPPEHVERAFERFWQLESGDQRSFGGVGLGLYLVRRIVERQNGWASLRPRDGGGTVAEVRLPRADANPGEV
jgi:two-component system phosphate regulon sensor histidine kinase PhoR